MKLHIFFISIVLLCSLSNENTYGMANVKGFFGLVKAGLKELKDLVPKPIRNYRPLQAMAIGAGLWGTGILAFKCVESLDHLLMLIPTTIFLSSIVVGGTGFLVMIKDGYGYLWQFAGG